MLGRRSFLAALSLVSCSRRERLPDAPPPPPPAPLPEMPEAGEPPLPRGEVGTETWTFDGASGGRAVVVVPAWTRRDERLPVLVALHGRGEAAKGPVEGAMGWPRDYALLRAIRRLCAPPLTTDDYEGFVESKHLAQVNRELGTHPWNGLIVVCPYLPDLDLGKLAPIRAYGDYLLRSVLPRVRAELPALAGPEATGIDGVSLGGAIALRVGLGNPEAFGAVGSLQAAIRNDQVADYAELGRAARAKNAALKVRFVTSKEDYFRDAIYRTSSAFRSAGVLHEMVDGPGPHDYPYNRGPGAIEMLLWHDRALARA